MPTVPPVAEPHAVSSAEAAALIAEAREHARRRRRRAALAAVIALAAIGGGIAWTATLGGTPPVTHATGARPAPVTVRTAKVTGYIEPCEAIAVPGPRYAAGTVMALRGWPTWKRTGPGTWRAQFPASVAARQQVAVDQQFSFDLAAGRYVIVADYAASSARSFVDVTVVAGRALHKDLPDICK